MHNCNFNYSSIYIMPPVNLAEDIVIWGRQNVNDDDIYVSMRDFTYGREDEIHVTVLYGIHSERSDQAKSLLANTKNIELQLGKVKVFDSKFRFDVIVIEVVSQELMELNRRLSKYIPFTDKHSMYKPHITIAYVKKGKGWRFNGINRWKGKRFLSDYMVFSSKNGTKERII